MSSFSPPFYDAFISYSHEDSDYARRVTEALSAQALDVFFDDISISYGADVPLNVESALEKSIKVLAIITNNSVNSDWADFERRFMWHDTYVKNEPRLIPVLFESVDIPPRLANLKYLDFSGVSFEQSISELLNVIKAATLPDIGPVPLEPNITMNKYYSEFIAKKAALYHDFEDQRLNNLKVVFNELQKNAYQHTGSRQAFLYFTISDTFVELSIEDEGDGFDIPEILIKNASRLDETAELGGSRGLILANKFCDSLHNEKTDRGHMITAIIHKKPLRKEADTFYQYGASREFLLTYLNAERIQFLKVNGEIDVYAAPAFKSTLLNHVLSPTVNQYLIDISNVDFMDSSGLGVFVGFLKRLRSTREDYKLAVFSDRENINKIFRITGLTKIFNIFNTIDEALNYLKAENV